MTNDRSGAPTRLRGEPGKSLGQGRGVDTFEERFRAARTGLRTILDSDDWLSVPAAVVEFQGAMLRPVSDFYRSILHGPRGPLADDIRGIAERLCLEVDGGADGRAAALFEAMVRQGVTPADVRSWEESEVAREDAAFAAEHPEEYARIQWLLDRVKAQARERPALNPLVEGLLMLRGVVYQAVSLINCGVALGELWSRARAGDDEALFQVARIDKSVLTEPWACARLRARQLRGDREFFTRLGAAVAAKPLRDVKKVPVEAVLLVARFWDEFRGQYESILEFLQREHVVRPSMTPEDLRKALRRAGLEKGRRTAPAAAEGAETNSDV